MAFGLLSTPIHFLCSFLATDRVVPELQKKSNDFPFRVVYGPVWSKYLPEFLEKRPARKPDRMKLAKFSLKHRFRGFITHTTFLLRKIFIFPLISLFVVFFILNSLNIS